MKRLFILLVLFIVCGICNGFHAATAIVDNSSQSEDSPVRFNLVRVESDILNINQYEYNYIILYPDGRCKCCTKSNSQATSFTGYYDLDTRNKKIRIFTEDRIQFYFIAPDEYTYVDSSRIIVTATLYGHAVRFEYRISH